MQAKDQYGSLEPAAFRLHPSIVRWAFTRFYHEFSWTYDAVAAAVSAGQWSSWTLAALPLLDGRVLELGCGTGNLQRALLGRPEHHAVGIDRSRQMLRLARRKSITPLACASAQALPFRSSSFDSLVATFPSEYIIAPATLVEARRVLRPGGQLVVVLGATYRSGTFYRRVVDLLYRLTLQRPVLADQSQALAPASPITTRLAAAGFTVGEQLRPDQAQSADLHIITAILPE
ncbi:MAG: methyltransferase domain-containing protein [Roseiflexaceae bacterium]|nr:methyltransferase domain-containing protein [Roseiflexaceae bacterium]